MNRRIWLYVLLAIVVLAASAAWTKEGRPLPGKSAEGEKAATLSIWVYHKGWDVVLAEFQKKYPQVNFDLRTFRSADQLYKELMASVSAGAAPQLAEVQSFYGVAALASSGAAVPQQGEADPRSGSAPLAAFAEPFRYDGKLWAAPVGGSIPVLYYRDDAMRRAGLEPVVSLDWSDVEKAASLPAKEGAEQARGHWGLAIDTELPWYLQQIGPSEEESVALWERWAKTLRIMPPLSHPMAASDFINGKIGLFVSSSDRLPMIERYIGGKFQFDLKRLPGADSAGTVPAATGIAMMHSTADKEQAARRLLAFLDEEASQTMIWRNIGLIPARESAVLRAGEEAGGSPRAQTILESVSSLKPTRPAADDEERWLRLTERLERIELEAGDEATAELAGDAGRAGD
ncbi:extracellular solute-binding protein [Paenibacillus hamazuiensis]|uniref:extracellular solute-binding protein n=1 Tax=Paenibacillus hamazuiensis TaxID=2936508 RepID=UPI00200E8CF6|nr:extracellular solute-binding protein [Paenibacillus hamazuiensis]